VNVYKETPIQTRGWTEKMMKSLLFEMTVLESLCVLHLAVDVGEDVVVDVFVDVDVDVDVKVEEVVLRYCAMRRIGV
jgi:hypothetical protein